MERRNAAAAINISNRAELTGVAQGSTSNEVTIEKVTSGASANKATVTIYKTDSTNSAKLLPGAPLFSVPSLQATSANPASNTIHIAITDTSNTLNFISFNFTNLIFFYSIIIKYKQQHVNRQTFPILAPHTSDTNF